MSSGNDKGGPTVRPGPALGYTNYTGYDLQPDINIANRQGKSSLETTDSNVCAAECNAVSQCLGFVMNNERIPTVCYLKSIPSPLYPVAAEKFNTTHSFVRAGQVVTILQPVYFPPPALPPGTSGQNGSVPGTGGFPPPFTSSSAAPPPSPSSSDISVGAIAGVSVAVLLLLVGIAGFFCFFLKRRKREKGGERPEPFDGLKVYSFAALRAATSDFRDVLGGGGSAEVFRAELDDRLVAVKKLKEEEDHRTSAQEFTAEARSLGQLLHMNLVRLLGYSSDPNRPKMLVYEFLNGGSLESLLYGNKKGLPSTPLPFDRRMEIALGVARGIEYCHHSIEPALVHRDIKPSNILMTSSDERGVPKVADFGLARILDPTDKAMGTLIFDPKVQSQDPGQEKADSMQSNNQSYASTSIDTQSTISVGPPTFSSSGNTTMRLPGALCTTIAGTFGYIDPEYLITGRATLKSDVYSFGIVLLELIMGVRPMHIHAHLQELVIQHTPNEVPEDVNTASYDYALGLLLGLGEGEAVSRVINILGQRDINAHQCFEALTIARQCLQEKGKLRPPMRQVVRLLEQLNEGQAKG